MLSDNNNTDDRGINRRWSNLSSEEDNQNEPEDWSSEPINRCRKTQYEFKPNKNDLQASSIYETLEKPFKYDKDRGRWAMTSDFYFASSNFAFGTQLFTELPVFMLLLGGAYMIPVYLIAVILCSVPAFIIQTFLGQFSGSGLISVFRVAPIFKGIGYAMLVWNLLILTYSSILAGEPLVYATNSIHSILPWMSCNNSWNTINCSTHMEYDISDLHLNHHSTVQFYRYIVQLSSDETDIISASWSVIYGVLAVWLLTLGILLQQVSFIGKFFRCIFILIICFFGAIFVHLLIHLEITWPQFCDYFTPTVDNPLVILKAIPSAFFVAMSIMGPGIGHTIVLASHNHFRRDSEKLTYCVCITHVVMSWMATICGRIAFDEFEDHVGMYQYHIKGEHFLHYVLVCYAYLFGSMSSLPNFWSFLFFAMIFLAELCSVIIQAMAVLTSIFDEYERLRMYKSRITVGTVFVMMIMSIYFCTNHGLIHVHDFSIIGRLTYTIIHILLIFVATWIYGRNRFQRDLQFMLGKILSDFKIFLIRFVTPLILISSIMVTNLILDRSVSPLQVTISQSLLFSIVPGYMLYKVFRSTGSIRNRIRQCFTPRDWYPVDADNRRFYDELMGVSELYVLNRNLEDQL